MKVRILTGLALLIGLVACGETTQVASLGSRSTASLCSQHMTATGADLLAVEAELGVRGELQCTTSYGSKSYVGYRTASSVGRTLYSRPATPTAGIKNCSDFGSAAAAQRFFISAGGPTRDPHGLDKDGDGNACEWGKTIRSSAAKYKPAPVRASAPRRSSSRTCYTGPRGGRYYYSASGNKVYGC